MVLICQWLGANMAVLKKNKNKQKKSCISHIVVILIINPNPVDDSGQSGVFLTAALLYADTARRLCCCCFAD